MSQLREERPARGLRERKKARTRATIQHHAVRLFREQGYDATTVEQVAAAAEVAPSTVFRYFPTKEDLVVSDEFDPVFIAAFRAQPPELTPIQAMRGAIAAAFAEIPSDELADQRERTALVLTEPALRGVSFGNILETMRVVAELVAERAGRPTGDPAVRAFTGAAFGVMLEVMLRWVEEPDLHAPTALDDALARLEAGLPL